MADEMEKDAIEIATFAMNEFMRETDMANHVKKEFDKKYRCAQMAARCPPAMPDMFAALFFPASTLVVGGFDASSARVCARSPTWHVVIGTNYGSHVVHATKHFIYFYLGPKAVLLFKSG